MATPIEPAISGSRHRFSWRMPCTSTAVVQSGAVADLHIVSHARVERLSNEETVRLGRVLLGSSGTGHISYPDGTKTAMAVIHEYTGDLSASARRRLVDVLGSFDETIGG